MNISILSPAGIDPEGFHLLPEVTWHDLGFDLILSNVTKDEKEKGIIRYIMMRLSEDPAVASYRIDIFHDLYHHPDLCTKVQALLSRIRFLEGHMSLRQTLGKTDSIWTLMARLREIDEYIDCVETFGDILSSPDLTSKGLKDLAGYIRQIRETSFFEDLKKDISKLRGMTSKVKSITLGINLDENYETHTVGIISLNDRPFTKTSLLANFTRRLTSGDRIQSGADWNGNYTFEPVDTDPVNAGLGLEHAARVLTAASNPLLAAGFGMAHVNSNDQARNTVGFVEQVMNQMMTDSVKELKEVLAKYVTIDIHSITNLIPEFLFYIRWADYIRKLTEAGYTFSKAAAMTEPEECSMEAAGIYNMKLAAVAAVDPGEIIPNDLTFSPERSCYLLTGANRGGKTTITQAIGQMFLLAQGGIYIPGSSFHFQPTDGIYTHFPADEDKTMDFGRLGEECSRFRDIYSAATKNSLVLLNESFSTTSFEEGYYIAYDAVRALLLRGCRTIFNTHMHKLAAEVDTINTETDAPCRAASLIVKNEGSQRSYKLALAPPEGTSYARDIAEKYGLTFEQLTADAGSVVE